MLFVKPDFYDKFSCIADRCRHSCCLGWEIDIVEDSLKRFMAVEGEFGQYMRRNIALEPEISRLPYLRLAEYFIYRHFANAPDEYEAALRLQFAFMSVRLICAMDSIFHDAESTRLYSSEIEYSDENVDKILDYIDENIPVS